MPTPFTGFAVFDLETTGISIGRHHRIIEIGIVRLDEDLDVVEEWETLINPERDISATDIHGITASDLRDAPTFQDLMVDIWHRFEGTVPVAHNFSFDKRFILSEFERAGIKLHDFEGICTMHLADQCSLSSKHHRRLVDLCGDLGIPERPAHSAGNDASMAAEILKVAAKDIDVASKHAPVSCPELWKREATPLGTTRQKVRDAPFQSPLQLVIERLNSDVIGVSGDNTKLDEYLLILDRVLEDRVLDPEETEELATFATDCGLSANNVRSVHEQYVSSLVALVLSDGVVTDDERADLNRVSGLLGVGAETVERLLAESPSFTASNSEDFSGKSVCFTGTLRSYIDGGRITKSIAEGLAESAGLTIAKGVTKKLDVLVVADPDTLSGKAKKARSYGTRIIAERSFWQKLGLAVD